jgi:hypothetical protein
MTTPLERAILRRQWVCGLIDHGLLHHPYRLDPHQWTREKCVLRTLQPTLKGLSLHLQAVSERARRVADEQTDRARIWDRMERTRFQRWANDLVEALEQYRRDCEAIQREYS